MKKLWYQKRSSVEGNGLFANRYIGKGKRVIQYTGDKVKKKIGYKRAEKHLPKIFIFELNHHYLIDGKVRWNPARFINHSCNPNCDIEIENNEIWVISLKNIKKNQELNYNYGYSFDSVDVAEHPCRCGSKNCVGYILDRDDWPKLKKFKKKLTKV